MQRHLLSAFVPIAALAAVCAAASVEDSGEGLTCTNEDGSKAWKCSAVGGDRAGAYRLAGPFTERDFPVGGVLRLWEFGVGDDVRLVCRALVRRGDDGALRLESNVKAAWTPAR